MFCKIQVNTWTEATDLNDVLHTISPIWVFRGQSDSEWSLETSFEREGKKHNLDSYYYKTCESNIITDFKRQAKQYIQPSPTEEDLVDWLAYIQHYGGPTRLLDFTYSFYVAAFFSMQAVGKSPSIWAVNVNQLIAQSEKYKSMLFDVGYRETLNEYVLEANKHICAPQDFNNNSKDGKVFLIEPYNQEERLAIQQGLFLFPSEIEKSFENNICGTFNVAENSLNPKNLELKNTNVIADLNSEEIVCAQIVFKPSIVYEAITKLKSMNISNATLFPGLDGFARSLDFHFHDMNWSFIKPRKNNI